MAGYSSHCEALYRTYRLDVTLLHCPTPARLTWLLVLLLARPTRWTDHLVVTMELSIDQLFASLQTTQKSKSTIRLSERNVVELIIKLKQARGSGVTRLRDQATSAP